MPRLFAGTLVLFWLVSSVSFWRIATTTESDSAGQSVKQTDAAVRSPGSSATTASADATPANLKIAFLGDQGLGPDAVAVLNLIKAEGAQAVVHAGDFDYTDNPASWDAQINSVFGENFPYFAVVGNHDESAWDGPNGYQQYLMNRLRRVGITWEGDLGVRSSLRFEGIFFVLTAPGVRNAGTPAYEAYIRERLAADRSIWSISTWHKNMERMQAGAKKNDTGWGVYEESANGGAIIITGHEHSYSRSHLFASISRQHVVSTADVLTLTKGQSFVVVTGLGGESIRPQRISGPWWARVYASRCLRDDQVCQPNADFGALFGVFNVDGIANKASFYFKDVDGKVVDRFTVMSRVESVSQTTQR
jgi:hypothetical protein